MTIHIHLERERRCVPLAIAPADEEEGLPKLAQSLVKYRLKIGVSYEGTNAPRAPYLPLE